MAMRRSPRWPPRPGRDRCLCPWPLWAPGAQQARKVSVIRNVVRARARRWRQWVFRLHPPSMSTAHDRLKIGLSACFSHADPTRSLFTGKTLQYVEQSIAHWLMSSGAMVVMVPCPTGSTQRGDVTYAHYAEWLDGLVLHGGADVWPGSYGETPLEERWSGDRLRDDYDKALVAAVRGGGQTGVRRLPRAAVAERGLRRHAVPGHQHPGARRVRAPRCRHLRLELPQRGHPPGQPPVGPVPGRGGVCA